MRIEHDLLGEMKIDDGRYYGIHTQRAMENFKITGKPLHMELVKALAIIQKKQPQPQTHR